MTINEDFDELVLSLQLYLEKERSTARGSNIDHSVAKDLREKITQKLDILVSRFANAPDIVFVRNLMVFAVNGLEDKTSDAIWNNYYKRGDTLEETANTLNVSTRTVKRFITQFPEKIVAFWFESLTQTQNPEQKMPLEKRAAKILEDEYGLTVRQAEVLAVFCLNRHLSRAKIQDDLLVISENTLKAHISRIVKVLAVKNLDLAVKKVLPVLKKQLGNEMK